jgi:hypothetical protein
MNFLDCFIYAAICFLISVHITFYGNLIPTMCHFLPTKNMMCHWAKCINIGTFLQLHIKQFVISHIETKEILKKKIINRIIECSIFASRQPICNVRL